MSATGSVPFADLSADQKRAITFCHSLVSEELNSTGVLEKNPSFHLVDAANSFVHGKTVWFEAVGLKTFSVQGLSAILKNQNRHLDVAWSEEGGNTKIYVTLDFSDYAKRVSKNTGTSTVQLVYQLITVLILCLIIGILYQIVW